MKIRTIVAALLLGALPTLAQAQTSPAPAASLSPVPSAGEQPFVAQATKDLEAKYPTAADAEKAGYIRYTNEDKSGSISYADLKWTSSDVDHPSQLWYDVNGRLLGADYSVPYGTERPNLFGMDPARWGEFHAHVHYGLVAPDGTIAFGATGGKKFTSTGGDLANPTPAQLVAAGIAKSPSDVKFVFAFPHIWDLEVWVLPNANGAFAELNPAVKPVHPMGEM
jgi:hypothetical protein